MSIDLVFWWIGCAVCVTAGVVVAGAAFCGAVWVIGIITRKLYDDAVRLVEERHSFAAIIAWVKAGKPDVPPLPRMTGFLGQPPDSSRHVLR